MRPVLQFILALGSLLIVLHAGPADARRVVLVIGNAEYKVEPLRNPATDATAVAEAFEKELKFDKVILRKNLGAEAFRTALLDFAREVSGAEVGIVYFAGHGVEVAGKNYLIPTDARLARAGDLNLEAILLDTVLDQLTGAKLKLVILDACRSNPYPLAGGKRTVTRGLSAIEPEDNTVVVYAAKAGTTADDGPAGKHSPFTEVLLKHIPTPGLEINFVFRRVRDGVLKATGSGQEPHVYVSLGAQEFFLVPAKKAPEVATVGSNEDLASLRAELAKLKALASQPQVPAPSPAEDIVTLKAEITRLEAKVKHLEGSPPPVPPATAPPPPAPKPKREALPDPTAYSLRIWPKGSLQIGQTVSTDTPHGRLTCTSMGPSTRPCRWGR